MSLADLRAEILRKHARLGRSGYLSRCSAQKSGLPRGKVIFRTEAAAQRAADELLAWGLGYPQHAYLCPHGSHFHLSKSPPREAGKGVAQPL